MERKTRQTNPFHGLGVLRSRFEFFVNCVMPMLCGFIPDCSAQIVALYWYCPNYVYLEDVSVNAIIERLRGCMLCVDDLVEVVIRPPDTRLMDHIYGILSNIHFGSDELLDMSNADHCYINGFTPRTVSDIGDCLYLTIEKDSIPHVVDLGYYFSMLALKKALCVTLDAKDRYFRNVIDYDTVSVYFKDGRLVYCNVTRSEKYKMSTVYHAELDGTGMSVEVGTLRELISDYFKN